MKKLLPLLLVASFMQGCDQKTSTGRFQLVAATQDEIVNNAFDNSSTTMQGHRIFKLDTVTGETWFYMEVTDVKTNGVIFTEGWKELGALTNRFQMPH